MHKLSIIIPAYNAEPYIEELIQRLKPQIRNEIEVLVVDDGSKFPYLPPYEWVRVIRQENKGLAGARNTGIENTDGEYMHFIDADDLVPENYADYILKLIEEEEPDFIELSWKSFDEKGGVRFDYKIQKNGTLPNPSACTRIYKRSFLGELRFNEKKDTAEDEDLYRRMDFSKGKKAVATEYMYFYRTSTPNSLSKRYRKGETHTKRLIYYFERITKDMTWLLDEVKKEREENEVVIMTCFNGIPELERYASVIMPQRTYAHELRGEETNMVEVVKTMETQVVMYLSNPFFFGGRETFIYNFCRQMSKHYDILVIFEKTQIELQAKLSPFVQVIKNDKKTTIKCDSLILNSVYDNIPDNITYKQVIQMVHGCKTSTAREIPTDRDKIVCVSQTVKYSFGCDEAIVIRNMTAPDKVERKKNKGKKLKLITASRLNTDPKWEDKGTERMIQLAKMLREKGIDFEWGYFAEQPIPNTPEGLVFHKAVPNIKEYIAESDYLVQLSGAEAFCYSVVEALEIGVPVIITPLPVFDELKIKDGENGYIVPFDMDFDVNKLKKAPEFKYKYNNGTLVNKWKALLGNTKPKKDYKPKPMALTEVTTTYRDMQMGRILTIGERVMMPEDRAKAVQDAGYIKIVEV